MIFQTFIAFPCAFTELYIDIVIVTGGGGIHVLVLKRRGA